MTVEALQEKLLNKGISCYELAQQVGKVKAPYCVIRDVGTSEETGKKGLLGRRTFEVICLVPVNNPTALPELMQRVRAALEPALRYAGEGETGIEESFGAIARSVMYTAMCRLETHEER